MCLEGCNLTDHHSLSQKAQFQMHNFVLVGQKGLMLFAQVEPRADGQGDLGLSIVLNVQLEETEESRCEFDDPAIQLKSS